MKHLKKQKMAEAIEKAIEDLKQKYNVVIDEEVVKELKPQMPEMEEAALADEIEDADQIAKNAKPVSAKAA